MEFYNISMGFFYNIKCMQIYIFDNILLKNPTGHLNSFYSQFFSRQDSLLSTNVFNETSPTSKDNTPKKSTTKGHTQSAF